VEGRLYSHFHDKQTKRLHPPSPPNTECPVHKQWIAPGKACPECGWERPG
jgi:hypothetical protein